jgi:hypothetical protein
MSLDDNLSAAMKAATKVRTAVPNSSNTAWTSSPVISTGGVAPKTSGLMPAIWGLFVADIVPSSSGVVNEVTSGSLSATVRSSGPGKLPSDSQEWLQSFQEIRAKCTNFKAGNCGELAAIACLELREAQVAAPVEYVQIWDAVTTNPALPHLIAVIGRQPNLLSGDNQPIALPNTWHADAVICDPWDRVFYAAHQYYGYWAGLRSVADRPNQLACRLLHQM